MSMDDVTRELEDALSERDKRNRHVHYGVIKRVSPLSIELMDSRIVLDAEDLLHGGPTDAEEDEVVVVAHMPDDQWAVLHVRS